jgi:hypothetical protein
VPRALPYYLLSLGVAITACSGDGESDIGVPPLEVITTTTGAETDPDGYAATVDDGTPMQIGDNDTVVVGDESAGSHIVKLTGVASNCRIERDQADTVVVTDTTTTDAGFAVACDSVIVPSPPPPPQPPPPTAAPIRAWTVVSQPSRVILFDTWGSSPSNFWAVGTDRTQANSGVIDHYDGVHWTEQLRLPNTQLDAVWGDAPNDVYAAGGHNDRSAGALFHYDGTGWSEISGPPVTPDAGDSLVLWQSVWGLSPSDVYAVGADYGPGWKPLVAHFDGSRWSLATLPTETLREPLDIWGTSPQNLYVAGVVHDPVDTSMAHDHGLILHFDGSAWSETVDSESGVHLKAVWGTAPDNVYMVGDPGAIVRWDGTRWAHGPQLVTTALHEVWGTSPDNVYAVAARGDILHFDGATWSQMASPTKRDLFGLWGLPSGEAWAVGVSGVIVHGTS